MMIHRIEFQICWYRPQTRSTFTNLITAIIVSTVSDFEQAMSWEQHINPWQNNIIEQCYTNIYKCGERMDINPNHAFDSAYSTGEQASICIPAHVTQTQTRILMLPVYSATGCPYHHTDSASVVLTCGDTFSSRENYTLAVSWTEHGSRWRKNRNSAGSMESTNWSDLRAKHKIWIMNRSYMISRSSDAP